MIVDKDRIARAVGTARYERGRRIAWAHAARCGNLLSLSDAERGDDAELYDIVDEVIDAAFAEAATNGDKMRAMCALYDDFPSYTLVTQLFTTIGYDGLSNEDMTLLYRFFAAKLSTAAIELAQPVSYVLWVDFFEEASRVDAAWKTVCGAISSDEGWRRLLNASGPVPESLKLPVIERLLPDPSFHDAILDALIGGVFDVYGRIERSTVATTLPMLQVDRSHPAYQGLLSRLADTAPIEFGWRLKN